MGITGEKQLPADLGHRVPGSQNEPSLTSTKGAPEFCCTNQGVSRHMYVADLGTHMVLQGDLWKTKAHSHAPF